MKFILNCKKAICVTLLSLLAPSLASAAVITINIHGTIHSSPALSSWQLANSIHPSESVTATIKYDPSKFSYAGQYNLETSEWISTDSSAVMTIHVGSNTFTADNPALYVSGSQIGFYFKPVSPVFSFFPSCVSPATLLTSGGYTCASAIMEFGSGSLNSLSIPVNLPNSFQTGSLGYFNSDSSASQGIAVNVSSLSSSVSGVPEPAAWALMLLGLGGIGLAMRSRRRQVAA